MPIWALDPEVSVGSSRTGCLDVAKTVAFDEVDVLHARFRTMRYPPHFHETLTIGFISAGQCYFCYRGRRERPVPDSLFFFMPGELHEGGVVDRDGYQYAALHFPLSFLASILGEEDVHPDQLAFRDKVFQAKPVVYTCRRLHQMLAYGTDQLAIQCELVNALSLFVRVCAYKTNMSPIPKFSDREMTHAREYIHANLKKPVRLRDIAHAAGVSPYRLIRLFKRHFGLTPYAYLVQLRIEKARALLRSGAPVCTAAMDLGFCDQSHFTNQFRRYVGVSPGKYATIVAERRNMDIAGVRSRMHHVSAATQVQ